MKSNSLGFSLIELSIVLIIIGLLIAGIVGGQSLIFSAKTQRAITEVKNWRQAVLLFKNIKNRLPGDINGSGMIGFNGQEYNIGDFGGKYSNIKVHKFSGSFVDLYLEKIIDFEPKNVSVVDYGVATPHFLDNKDSMYFEYRGNDYNNKSLTYFASGLKQDNYITIFSPSSPTYSRGGKSFISNAKFLKNFDTKIDDGKYNEGRIRSACNGTNGWYNSSYEEAMSDSKYKCEFSFISLEP